MFARRLGLGIATAVAVVLVTSARVVLAVDLPSSSGDPIPFSVPTPTPAVFMNSPQPSAGPPAVTGPATTATSSFAAAGTRIGALGCGGPSYSFTALAEGILHVTTTADGDSVGVLALHGTVTATPLGDGPSYDGTFSWTTIVSGLGGAAMKHVTFTTSLRGSDGSVVTEQIVVQMVLTTSGAEISIAAGCP